jgi:uncharacterized membrane protein (DUF106 family)
MDLSKFLGVSSYRILIAATMFSIVNLPIQMVQLVLLGKLSFPTVGLFNFPWWMIMGGGIATGVFCLWVSGYVMEYFKVPQHQNRISNKNNPEISEILERLERIEQRLNERTS